jgi:hypothetical protein
MAAEVVAVRAMLGRMGLNQDASTYVTDAMGLDSLVAWRDTLLDSELVSFQKKLSSPGGTLMQGGVLVRHPGFPYSIVAISNLKIMRSGMKHFQRIQRTLTPATITLEWIAAWEFLIRFYKDATDKKATDDDLPKIIMSDWAKTKDLVITHFSQLYGEEGVPLAYLLRENVAVTAEADDPQAAYNDNTNQELIKRAPHVGPSYRADNATLCRLLKKMTTETAAYEYICQQQTNGRLAWMLLMDTYLGKQHTQLQAAKYEKKLASATYRGESARFTFQKYWDIHTQAHTRLDGLTTHGYHGMDEGTKIRYFIDGIQDPKLNSVIEIVRGNESFPTFVSVARRIMNSVDVAITKSMGTSRNISDVRVHNRKGEEIYSEVEADMTMEDKFYEPADWNKLSAAQKKGVLAMRGKRNPGHGGAKGAKAKKAKQHNASKNDKRKIAEIVKKATQSATKPLRKEVKALTRKVGSLNIEESKESSDSESSDEEQAEPRPKKQKTKKTNNRNNRATNRGPP